MYYTYNSIQTEIIPCGTMDDPAIFVIIRKTHNFSQNTANIVFFTT